jgi:uncharacterized protein
MSGSVRSVSARAVRRSHFDSSAVSRSESKKRESQAEYRDTWPSKPNGFYGTKGRMKRDEIIKRLKEREADLRAHGVTHAALFGSVARGEQRPDSDIDILVDLDPAIVATMFDYAGVKAYVASLFQGSVDVIDREALKPRVRPRATADAIYAF